MTGWVLLGWTSTKQELICLAQGHNACSVAGEAEPRNPSVSNQALHHWATALRKKYLNLYNLVNTVENHDQLRDSTMTMCTLYLLLLFVLNEYTMLLLFLRFH